MAHVSTKFCQPCGRVTRHRDDKCQPCKERAAKGVPPPTDRSDEQKRLNQAFEFNPEGWLRSIRKGH